MHIITYSFFFYSSPAHPDLHSFPTRRSSDLHDVDDLLAELPIRLGLSGSVGGCDARLQRIGKLLEARVESNYNRIASDRKSTRLNSSHSQISYAVFCLKKKKKKKKKNNKTKR